MSGRDSYTAFGFANPTRRVLAAVLHTRAEVTRFDAEAAGTDGATSPDSGHRDGADLEPAGLDGTQAPVAHVGYSSDVVEVVEEYVYLPFRRPFLVLVRAAQRLQSGRLDAYLAYMLIALIAVLAVVTAMH